MRMRQWARKFLGGGILSLVCISSLYAANLDLSAGYNVQALSYSNLNYNPKTPDNQAFIANDASLGITVRKIELPDSWEGTSMDLGIKFHALGVSGSTVALKSSPFGQIAANYPSVGLTPFIENAYLRIHKILGKSIDATLGRQNFMLGSGLLLDDDGAGFTGATIKANLPFWETSLEGFYFNTDHSIYNYNTTAAPATSFFAPSGLNLMGFTFALPTDGLWELNELIEDGTGEIDPGLGYTLSSAMRSFTSMRYQINYGPIIFDGEAAMEKGYANTNGANGAPNSISYNGNAAVARAKWKQPLYKVGEGIAHVALAHGSGATPGDAGTDTAFFPAHGHQFDGLQRNGFGAFFAATPYAALGTAPTASNLPGGATGIDVVSGGFTPPAYDNMTLDLDYFLYRADQVVSGSRNLGDEWDATIRRSFRDRLTLSVTGAVFLPGAAAEGGPNTTPIKTTALLISLNASGRF
jgi:hypothetical protein